MFPVTCSLFLQTIIMIKKILKITGIVLLVALVLFFIIAPGYIDRSKNTVVGKTSARVNRSWYDSMSFIADLHCDELLWDRNLLKKHDHGHVDLPRLQEANMAFQVFTIVSKTPKNQNYESNSDKTDNIGLLSFAQLRPPSTWFSTKARAIDQCKQLQRYASKSNGQFRIIYTQKDLRQLIADRATNKKLVGGMLGLEGAHCLEKDLNTLDEFYKNGVRYIGLAHFFDNEWAGSAHGETKYGLTAAGEKLIKRMDSLHILIDLAHASPKTIEDVFRLTSGPILVSHTGVQGVCNNQRNLSDQQLLEIGKRNGIVGIGLWEKAVCGSDAAATAKSIRYVADKIGVDKVAIGSDFDGAVEAPFDITGFPILAAELEKQGFNHKEIAKIMGENIRDFFLKNLPQ